MKPENGKKSKLWLWIVLAVVAVLAVAGVIVGMMFLKPSETPATDPTTEVIPESEVYWNIDKAKFTENSETGLSTRDKSEDGLYHFRFISQGQVMDIATADKQLVNYIDTMDACGLVLDADGLIIDVLDVKTIAVETAKSFYVKKISGTTVTVNSSIAMNGMDITFEVSDSTYIMDVRSDSETLGQKVELNVMDVVCVYGTQENPAVSIFLMDRPESSPLYLRVDRLYSSTEASTTRVPDENGVYTIPFAINGKVEQLKCKDKAVVTGIDSGTDAKQVMGLTFDEEGYITGTILAATAARGRLACQVYNVTAINGNAVEATRILSGSEQGKVVNFTLTEDTQIIINEADCGHFIGERMPTLEMDDRVVVWTDMENNALYIKIDRRRVYGDDIAMYYNFNKQYDSTNKVTKRVPNAAGYYEFELASGGKVVKVKTKDKDIATKIDADSYQFFALKVQKGIVKAYYTKDCLTGGYGIGGQRFVAQVMGTIVRIVSGSDFNSGGNYIMTPNTEVYLMTKYPGAKIGSKTTLQEGDRVIAARNIQNEITHIYVLDRVYSGTKLYYNASRKYNSTTQETSRTPDAEGYYVFDVFCDGKALQVKTKSKDIATAIDLQNAPIVAMKVSNGIVKAAYPAIAHAKYTNKVFNYNYVNQLTANKELSCYYFSGGVRYEAAGPWKLASNCKIFNVSNDYNSHRGEKTSTVKPGDRIQALRNLETGEITHIWILGRLWDSPLYINPARKYNSTTKETTRVPNEEGYYEVELFADGKMKTFKTKDKDVMSVVDSYSSETVFAMKTNGNIILKADTYTSSKRGMNLKCSFRDVMKVSGSSITLERKRPGQSDTGAISEVTITSKTKIYDVGYYSGDKQYTAAKLKKGDRVSVYADQNNEVTYIFIWYRSMHEKGYESKCPHCNKVVWWEPFTGSFINTALDQVVHYYQPADYARSGQATMGKNVNSDNSVPRFTAVFDMNGKTLTTTGGRNFLVYFDLIIVDTVGGGVLEANGYQGGGGGNFLVSGGTVTVNNGVTIRQNNSPDAVASLGGNFNVSNLTVTDTGKVNVGKIILNDAKLEAWDCVNGGNINLGAGAELIVKKATITGGDIRVNEGAIVKLNGSKINIGGEGIVLLEGAKIAESKLSGDSKVVVQANGIFTEKLSNANEQKAFYEPEFKFYPIEVKDGALWTDRDPSKPDYVKEPEIPALPELMKVDNTALALDANGQAKCPVCNEVVTWTALTDNTAAQTLGNDKHFYLPADITYETADMPYIQVPAGQAACLHLNDKNLIATNAQVAHVNGNLNIMGNGTVSGNGFASMDLISTKRPDLHAATIEANGSKSVINLYGGTYIKSAENDARMADITKSGAVSNVNCANYVVEVHGNGGTINMFEGAVIDGRDVTKKGAVMSYWGMFNLYGGTVYGGSTTAVQAGNWTDTKSGGVSIYGGTVQAGSGNAVSAGGVTNGPATLNIYGGQINGNTSYDSETKFTLAGNPVMTKLSQPSAKVAPYYGLITLGKLTDGASISIKGTEAISFQSENAAEYVKYFKSLTDVAIEHINYAVAFHYEPDPELPEVPEVMPAVTEDLQFIGSTTWALCPLCEEYVKWTPITQATYGTNAYSSNALADGTHLYLAEDISYTGTATFMYGPSGSGKSACLHLNGHDFTASNALFVQGYTATLNVMGTGTVAGNGKSGATVVVNTSDDLDGGIMLHSGTYTKVGGNTTGVLQVNNNGGRIVLMKDATVVTKAGHLAAMVGGGHLTNGHLAIAGTVEGGYVESVAVAAAKKGDVILELNGADLQGGAKVAADTIFGVFGETKIDGLNMTSGAKIAMSELSGEAAITVKANGIFTEKLDDAEAQKAFYSAITGYYAVEVKEGALWTADDPNVGEEVEPEPEPDLPADPAIPTLPELLKVDNSNLNLIDGKAKCPVCDKEVEWVAISDVGDRYELAGDVHYYLANDITYEVDGGTAISISYNKEYKGLPACLHLNGHNITATKGIAIFGGMELNIMGNGIVSGNRTANNQAATLQLNSSGALVNVYGGTYIKDASNTAPIVNLGTACKAPAKLNIFEGVVIGASDFSIPKGNSVQVLNGTVNIYGGEIYGSRESGWVALAGNYGDAYGTVNIFGGLLQAKSGGGISCNKGSTMGVYGGAIKGTSYVYEGANFIIGGTASFNRLSVKEGGKITLAEMADGANITVSADGIFTNPSANAAKYVQYFHGFKDSKIAYKTPTVVDNALFTEQGEVEEPEDPTEPSEPTEPTEPSEPTEPELPADPAVPALPELLKVDNANLTLDSASKAECPVCKKSVQWTVISDESAVQKLEGGKHYVLDTNLVFEGEEVAYIQAADATAACLHLNGHDITATKSMVAYVTGKLNIMGNGTVAGNGVTSNVDTKYAKHRGGTLEVNKTGAVLNVYGGTYTKAADNTLHVIAQVFGNSGELNVYEGATFDAKAFDKAALRSWTGAINVYGGDILGGKGTCITTSNWTNRAGGTGTANIFGGNISAGSGAALSTGGTELARGSVNIYGGKISGNFTFSSKTADVVIGGNPVMTYFVIGEGNKITFAEMTEGASIAVTATGVFTNPSANAETYLKYFTARDSAKEIAVVENALSCVAKQTPPVNPEEPEQPEQPEQPTEFDNSNLVFEEGTNKAKCPLCGEVVEWIALTQEGTAGNAITVKKANQHYYLAEDITFSAYKTTGADGKETTISNFITGPGSEWKLCVHLNGHNFTGVGARFLFGYASNSNVMGNGIVATGLNTAASGGIAWNTNNQKAISINLYGGTYTVAAGNDKGSPIAIQNNGGVINIYEDVTVIGSATAPAIYVGTSSLRASVLNIQGATVYGAIDVNSPKVQEKAFTTTVVLEDAIVDSVELAKNVSLTVAGNTVIGNAQVTSGAKITIGELGSAAKINVSGEGVITEANDKLAAYLGSFAPVHNGYTMSTKDNAIVLVNNVKGLSTADLAFVEGTNKAVCPACNKEVEWTAISSITEPIELAIEGHAYLANDIVWEGEKTPITYNWTKEGARKYTCLHLNGHNLTATKDNAIFVGNYLNLMGNGTVSGNKVTEGYGATVSLNSTTGLLNLYGGTYVKATENTVNPILMVRNGGGIINVYDGAIVDGTGLTAELGAGCIEITGRVKSADKSATTGTLNVYGGIIKNGTNTKAKGYGGNIALTVNGVINVYGGTISGGKAPAGYGGNIATKGGNVNIYGGTITDGEACSGGNIHIQAKALTVKNALILNGIAKNTDNKVINAYHGGNISVSGGTLYIGMNTMILNGHADEGHGGNVRCYNSPLTMDGGVVAGGTSYNNNGNIWVYSDKKDAEGNFLMVDNYFNGGISLTASGVAKAGNGLHAHKQINAHFAGNFTVLDAVGATVPGVKLEMNSVITEEAGYTGSYNK